MTSHEYETRPKPILRPAHLEDVRAIREMHATSWLAAYPNDAAGVTEEWVRNRVTQWLTPEGIEKSKNHFREILDNPDHFYRIAVEGSEVVGLVHASRVDGNQYLEALYIDQAYYGSGLASQMIGEAGEWLDPQQPVSLEVAIYNQRAQAFYKKYGFEAVENSGRKFAGMIPIIMMERKGDMR